MVRTPVPVPNFFYHPRMTHYDFGPKHPLKPERLRRTMALLEATVPGVEILDPGLATMTEVERVHSHDYVLAVQGLSCGDLVPQGMRQTYGFWSLDNPPFPDMYEASLAYCAGSIRAAERVRDGEPLAFGLAGGLHHAQPSKASGFCIFNDCALACRVLRERWDRVAYVDIDLHHGDGVEMVFWEDPSVLTCSIHQDGRTLYPGTGFVQDTALDYSAINVPLAPHTTGDVWLDAFRRGIMPALERFRPGAIVLQMGTDPHALDPLGHLEVEAQTWLTAVSDVRDLGLPIVALGGGGYNLTTVPRMWVAAVLTLRRMAVPERVTGVPEEWGMETFLDPADYGRGVGRAHAEGVLDVLERDLLPKVGR